MTLAADVTTVAKQYIGPAAPAFLSRELKALGVTAETLTPAQVVILAQHAKRAALRLMEPARANEFAEALAACAAKADAGGGDVRAGRIALLREAVAFAPADLTAHRRLAATLANAGDMAGASAEYERFVGAMLTQGDGRRALLEITYARETLGERPELLALVDRLAPGEPLATGAWRASSPPVASPAKAAAAETPSRAAAAKLPAAPVVAQAARGAAAPPVATTTATPAAVSPSPAAVEPELDLPTADWRAMALIGSHHPSATPATLRTARRLLDEHKLNAASDLLLDYIGAGYTDREAQRLLIEVDCGIGRKEIAREKCRLLGTAYRLDGRVDSASDVERFASFI